MVRLALQCVFCAEMLVFFAFLGVCFNIRCLGAWE